MNDFYKKICKFILGSLLILGTGCSKDNSSLTTSNDIGTTSFQVEDRSGETQKEVVEIKVASLTNYSSLVNMIADVKPSVVDVSTYISAQSSSAGSGVIIGKSTDGYYIITNHHVIDNGRSFKVTVYQDEISSGLEYDASLIGGSPKDDIAVLKVITKDSFKCASFIENSDEVKVGTEVIAIGNPLGIYGGTVTKGIISATARDVVLKDVGSMRLFQTDAAINSGNSGGALFNENGLLVAIVNSGYSSYEGLNFAIPANQARSTAESLINTYHTDGDNYGYVAGRSNIGINLASSSIYLDSSLGNRANVVYVASTSSNSDASKNNIYSYNDVVNGTSNYFYAIKSINGVGVNDSSLAQEQLDKAKVGDSIKLTLQKVSYKNSGGFIQQTYFYLDGNEFEIQFNVGQYIYSLPN